MNVRYCKRPYLPWRYLRRRDWRLANTYAFMPPLGVDLLHLWNGICLNRHPWITSFEAHLPRYPGCNGWWRDMALDRLHSRHCVRLLALSEFARHFFLCQHAGRIDESVRNKVEVLYGGVEVRTDWIDRRRARPRSDGFSLCFVGHDFFRKGGPAVLAAFARLKKLLPQMKLTVISRVSAGDYVTRATVDDQATVKHALASMSGVEWRQEAPHEEVLRIMSESDVVLLPTLDDTFGWSVVEAMSVARPVIGTNVCAMPEMIVHGVNGYLIELELQPNRRWEGLLMPEGSLQRRSAVEQAYERLAGGIVNCVVALAENPDLCARMGQAGRERVERIHDPARLAARLRRIYEEAVA